jgi:hypothetical protein
MVPNRRAKCRRPLHIPIGDELYTPAIDDGLTSARAARRQPIAWRYANVEPARTGTRYVPCHRNAGPRKDLLFGRTEIEGTEDDARSLPRYRRRVNGRHHRTYPQVCSRVLGKTTRRRKRKSNSLRLLGLRDTRRCPLKIADQSTLRLMRASGLALEQET